MTWLTTTWSVAFGAVMNAVGISLTVILFTRLAGLRSFSKMSAFDFAMTVAVGSMMASTIVSSDISLLLGVVGLGAIYGLQAVITRLRSRVDVVERGIDNQPVLLLRDGEMREAAMRDAKVTRADLLANPRF